METKPVTIIHTNGGFARSTLWLQMLADVFNVPVFVPNLAESSVLGAVIAGMEALEIATDFDMTAGQFYQPSIQDHAIYMHCFEKFERVYELLKSEFNSDHHIIYTPLPVK